MCTSTVAYIFVWTHVRSSWYLYRSIPEVLGSQFQETMLWLALAWFKNSFNVILFQRQDSIQVLSNLVKDLGFKPA